MGNERKCEDCIWFDQCHEDEVCDCYDPSSNEEQETSLLNTYEADLNMRHELYQEQIDEQGK